MRRLLKRILRHGGDTPFEPASPHDSEEALTARVEGLLGDEYEIYKWMREFYSDRWIAETLLLDLRTTRAKTRSVCRRLGVRGKKALIRIYGCLGRPQSRLVSSDEIDEYVDERTEKEIRNELEQQ